MENYTLQPQEIKGNSMNIPHFYEINGSLQYSDTLQEYTGQIPTLHSVAQTYEKNEKLKEIFNNNVFK